MKYLFSSPVALLAIITAILGFVFYQMPPAPVGLIVPISILFLVFTLLICGFLAYRKNANLDEYFAANSELPVETTVQSLSSSWIMLGNVVIAGMWLGQSLGLATIWMTITWGFAFVVISSRLVKIRKSLRASDTLHSYLHTTYNSPGMRRVAATVTLTVGVGVFAIELIAGLALLSAILPSDQADFLGPILVVLLISAMCVASAVGGVRAVITTDALLWKIVALSVVLILLFSYSLAPTWPSASIAIEQVRLVHPNVGMWEAGAFLLGVTALQVPLLLADYGTWQRVKATDEVYITELPRRMVTYGWAQAILWFIPVIAGFVLLFGSPVYPDPESPLYRSSGPLMEMVQRWLSLDMLTAYARAAVLFVFVTGMLAVMVSTANTYILIAVETWVRDLAPGSGEGDDEEGSRRCVQRARRIGIVLALLGCIPAAALVQTGVYLMGVIVVVFSVQVALAPASALALYRADAAAAVADQVAGSTIIGFITAIGFGLWASYVASDWWNFYGVYLTSVVALLIPLGAISVALVARGYGFGTVRGFASRLFWPLS